MTEKSVENWNDLDWKPSMTGVNPAEVLPSNTQQVWASPLDSSLKYYCLHWLWYVFQPQGGTAPAGITVNERNTWLGRAQQYNPYLNMDSNTHTYTHTVTRSQQSSAHPGVQLTNDQQGNLQSHVVSSSNYNTRLSPVLVAASLYLWLKNSLFIHL